ncbi:sensor histidine kinase [Nonomuraea africana]|uniref:histidine kinase n=1 Tax=Nonomuraea africana TaxID=46171 RepID=A0ABR9KFK4_9ACTN|nr:histidine kinase [Nonomuraea africana]MBE1560561.1 signal transduction histidine kinase [Nonomuraea africana]
MSRYVLVPCAAVAVVISTIMAYGNQQGARPLDVLGYALLGATALGLAWLRGRPEVSVAVCGLAAAALLALGYAYALWALPALIAVFAAIAEGRRRVGWAGAAFLVACPAVGVARTPDPGNLAGLLVWVLVVALVGQLAEVSRARRAYIAELERTREEEARRRARDERLKVARELHDVTSHTVSLIALQAAVAAEAVERAGGPPEARAALAVIRTASREAMAEMKGLLGVLRQADGAQAGRSPMPGLDRLGDLVTSTALPVRLAVEGDRRPLSPAVELTAYRIVQEALTNTMRHARAAAAQVTLRYESGGVVVEVVDDGGGLRGDRSAGHGLAGMAERVAAVGGALSTGDRPEGGFGVAAWLPA